MPELPEVETIVRGLANRLCGRRLLSVAVNNAAARQILRTPPGELVRALQGARVLDVRRYGKHIVFRMARSGDGHSCPSLQQPMAGKQRRGKKARPGRGEFWWVVHLGMTGQLTCEPASSQPRPHTHACFVLESIARTDLAPGSPRPLPGREVLRYTDIRRFGRMEIAACAGKSGLPPRLQALGPDPLAISEEEFAGRLRGRAARLKALLLDQRFLRGLGNIYADEILFRAGLHPAMPGSRVSRRRAAALWRAMRQVLEEAIEQGGSSVSDYLDAGGRAGSFQQFHRVYGRAGEPCLECSQPLRRALLAGRGTTYCPRCQRR